MDKTKFEGTSSSMCYADSILGHHAWIGAFRADKME
jgi:hypothetical protein